LSAQKPWAARLARAKPDDRNIRADAFDWRTCSVGEAIGFPDKARISDAKLSDALARVAPQMYDDGADFDTAICNADFEIAEKLHARIQANGTEIAKVKAEILRLYDIDLDAISTREETS